MLQRKKFLTYLLEICQHYVIRYMASLETDKEVCLFGRSFIEYRGGAACIFCGSFAAVQ